MLFLDRQTDRNTESTSLSWAARFVFVFLNGRSTRRGPFEFFRASYLGIVLTSCLIKLFSQRRFKSEKIAFFTDDIFDLYFNQMYFWRLQLQTYLYLIPLEIAYYNKKRALRALNKRHLNHYYNLHVSLSICPNPNPRPPRFRKNFVKLKDVSNKSCHIFFCDNENPSLTQVEPLRSPGCATGASFTS